MRQYIGRLVRPFSKQISSARKAAEVVSHTPRHSLRLLLGSWFEAHIQSQPDLYPFAAYLGERFDCNYAIIVGSPTAQDLLQLYPQFEIIGLVPAADLQSYRRKFGFGTWLEVNDNLASSIPDAETLLPRAVIVCADLDQVADPGSLLKSVKSWLEHSPVCVLTTTDQNPDSGHADESSGQPVRLVRWSLTELEALLIREGFNLEFIGRTASEGLSYQKQTSLAVLTRDVMGRKACQSAPPDFRVVAFMAAYNEEDIIVQSIKKWTDQGVSVRVVENWSTDATYDLAKELEGHLPVTVERFPADGPSEYFDWAAMLERMEILSREIEADWFVRRGADEVLASPWPGISYRDGLYLVDQAGFNCVDHTIVEFHPVDDGFQPGMDHEVYFKHFDLKNLSHSNQRKAWKNFGQQISTIPSAGHDVVFEDRRIFPFKFLVKHYSFRSQQQAEKKVFRERKARWNPKERARGWHIHYDSILEGHRFVKSATEKEVFNEGLFNSTYLVERLSGIGTRRRESKI